MGAAPASSSDSIFSFQPMPSTESMTQEESVRLLVLKRTYDLFTGGLALVAALAWNDAVQSLFAKIFGPTSTLMAKFAYAVFVTVIIVILGTRLARVTRALENRLTNGKK